MNLYDLVSVVKDKSMTQCFVFLTTRFVFAEGAVLLGLTFPSWNVISTYKHLSALWQWLVDTLLNLLFNFTVRR